MSAIVNPFSNNYYTFMGIMRTGKTQRKAALFWLLVMAVALRSLIAPGLMLNPEVEGPLGVGISFCDGFDTIASQDFFSDPHSAHSHTDTSHGSHGHEHPAGTDHDLSGHGCGLWNVSSLYVHTLHFSFEHTRYFGPDRLRADYHTPFGKETYRKPQQARAPPRTLLI